VGSPQTARCLLTLESALVVPVPEAETVVKNLRIRHDPAAAAGAPVHITVLVPFMTPATVNEAVLAELAAIFSGLTPFDFILSTISRFTGAVYLVPDPADRFSRLTAAIATRWPETPPYGGIYSRITPHLTVAHTSDDDAIEEIRHTIEPILPIACTARQAWLMVSRAEGWSLLERFPFGETPL